MIVSNFDCRSIPKIWDRSTVFILGGGPSIKNQDLSKIWKYHTIGVNHSFRLGPVEVLWFGDYGFYLDNKKDVSEFCGLKITCATQLPEKNWPDIKRVRRRDCVVKNDNLVYGIVSHRPDMVAWNKNSGGSAINLAYHLGAKRIILLGFDMTNSSGVHHWHGEKYYGKFNENRNPYVRHLQCFRFIADDAKKLGIEILNATPGSAIKDFEKIQFENI